MDDIMEALSCNPSKKSQMHLPYLSKVKWPLWIYIYIYIYICIGVVVKNVIPFGVP